MNCSNCETEIFMGNESSAKAALATGLCSPCRWLADSARSPHPSWDRELRELARCGFTNRRWQMRFLRGELT